MDSVYENTDFVLSTLAAGEDCSQYKGNSTKHQKNERKISSPMWTKVLLIGLAVSLVFALLGLCFLGIKYVSISVQLSAQENNATIMARELEELAANYTSVTEDLFINKKSTGCALCAVNWIYSGGKCYYFSTYKMNWTQSRDQCVTLGGHLVIIDSSAEQDFLTSNVKVNHWIGLNDLNTEGNWIWVNNQPLNDSVEFWIKRENGVREPDNWTEKHVDGEDCGSLGHPAGETDFWTDAYCSEMKRFVCESAAAV